MFLLALMLIPVSQAYKVDDGREALALYNEEVKVLDREYGPATIKEEFIAEKGKFYQSLSAWHCKTAGVV